LAASICLGSHTNQHKEDAFQLANHIGEIAGQSDQTAAARIAQIRRVIDAFHHRAATGPFSFFASTPLEHDFKTHFLAEGTPILHSFPA
jgi:hypothetical protein